MPMVIIDGVAKRNITKTGVYGDSAVLPLAATLSETSATVEWYNERIAVISVKKFYAEKKWILDISVPYLVPYGSSNIDKDNLIEVSSGEYKIIKNDIIVPVSSMKNILQKIFYENGPSISFDAENGIIDIGIETDNHYASNAYPIYKLSEDGTYYVVDRILVYDSLANYYNVVIYSTYNDLPVKKIESLGIYENYSDGYGDLYEQEETIYSQAQSFAYKSKKVKINSLSIPYTIEEISDDALDLPYVGNLEVDPSNKNFKCVGTALYSSDGKRLIKQFYNGSLREITVLEGTETIAKEAFKNNEKLTTIKLPSTLVSIEENAFFGCYRLVEIYNPSSLDIQEGSEENGMIAKYALGIHTSTGVPSAVKLIDEDFLFFENEKRMVLIDYVGDDKVLKLPVTDREYKIGYNAFYNNTGIFQIYIPRSVTYVSEGAFSGATNLYRVNLNSIENFLKITFVSSPLEYGAAIYVDGKCLKSVTITKDVLRGAFKNCNSIEEVIFAEGVSRIEDEAFRNCANLERVIMANTVVEIGSYAFAECNSLRELELSPSLREIPEYCFTECDFLRKIVIPKSVLKIKKCAFYGCDLLDTVKLHDNLDYVGSQAFANCIQLRVIYIPYGLPRAKDAFDGVQVIQREHFD
jgi:hypothetical protein